MSNESVLIAALSGRSLAQSARRAGYTPLVADCFGDEDTRTLAADSRRLRGALRRGFRVPELVEALDELTQSAKDNVIGLILGPGFEDSADVVTELQTRFTLLGCPAEGIAQSKDPERFFGLLGELGIVHPQTSQKPPENSDGWISKRVGGCGGRHIRRLSDPATARPGRYFQEEISGDNLSALAIVGGAGSAFGFSQSWNAPFGREPFRYGGSVSADGLEEDLEARLVDTCLALIEPLGLLGLVSFDFIITADEAFLVEVNPRPGASLDVLDDAHGTLFAAHVAACRGEDFIDLLSQSWRPSPRAMAYVYADRGPLTVAGTEWPEWVSDRPAAGAEIETGGPVATVHAEAATPLQAVKKCHQRITELQAVL